MQKRRDERGPISSLFHDHDGKARHYYRANLGHDRDRDSVGMDHAWFDILRQGSTTTQFRDTSALKDNRQTGWRIRSLRLR